ncbi:hypothetical protein ACGFJ7_13270 [Actinoplanes sp. NPDC048988]|uniref:hypothetical protein n=1 Tax=Actinoplanes sp. NPDC048988 TaxID=3363901 RepID=UPI00371A7187
MEGSFLSESRPASTGSWSGGFAREQTRWSLRDASGEAPFAAVIGRPLVVVEPTRNDVEEVIGLHLALGGRIITLQTWQGEMRT